MSQGRDYEPSSLADQPELTQAEISRRVLGLITKLRSADELSLQMVKEELRLPLRYAPLGKMHAFGIHLPESGWYYKVGYYENEARGVKALSYEASNPAKPDADMTPVCGLGFGDLASALKDAGFSIGVSRDEIGRIEEHTFYRTDVNVRVTERKEFMDDGKPLRSCIKTIDIRSDR